MAAILAGAALRSSSLVAADAPPSASAILQELREFRECGSVLYVAAHPDDENTQFIAYLAKQRAMRVGYLSLTRGEGGQDLIGPELGDPLGVIRTQELLAARRIDGGQQFFTRARDFGFSKDHVQTLAKWDKPAVLSDVVRVIRTFQPDVIVTRFPPEPGGTHGHHTASTILALEAFKLAGDANYPGGQDKTFPSPWQPRRIFWNSFRGDHERPTLKLDLGGYIAVLGESVGEIAARSRSSHRSQGYGSIASRGTRFDEYQPLDDLPAGRDLFDGIDITWDRWPSMSVIGQRMDTIIARFNPQDPAAIVPALLELRDAITRGKEHGPALTDKLWKLNGLIADCLGLYVETTVPQSEVVPGEVLKLRCTAVVRSGAHVRWESVKCLGSLVMHDDAGIDLHENQSVVRDNTLTLPVDMPLTAPYWLREEGTPGMYRVDDPALIGQPASPPAMVVVHTFTVGGWSFDIYDRPVQVASDPAKGEIRRELGVIPPVSLTPARDVQLFAPGASGTVEIEIRACRDQQDGALALAAPDGWTVSPASQPFKLAATGEHARFTFNVTAPAQPTTGFLNARATVGGKTYDTSRQEIRYEHIPPQLLQPPARVKAVCADVQIRGREIGYLPGAGDRTAEAIGAMGCHVTPLTGADLTPERLRAFDAVAIGVRAFNVRTDLSASALDTLFAYVENGGTVVEQYNTPNELRNTRLAPYDLTLDRNLPAHRVTNENAPVTLLAPDHPVFNSPNKITAADFDGWVQERGLNFPSAWDTAHWTPLLACSDPGEAPLTSGLLVANHGKGRFVYTGLSFFRQLPAGVPGAYRLFANLLSLSGHPQ